MGFQTVASALRMLARPVKRCESVQAKVSRSTSVVVSGLDSSTLLHSSCWLVTALQTRTQSTLAPSTQPAKRKRPSSPTSASSKRPAVATPSTQLEQLHLSHDNDMGNQEATRLYGQLTSEWANGAGDQAKIRSLLAQLKVRRLARACSGRSSVCGSSGGVCGRSSAVILVDERVAAGFVMRCSCQLCTVERLGRAGGNAEVPARQL